jgi:GntR family transcriptional regulator
LEGLFDTVKIELNSDDGPFYMQIVRQVTQMVHQGALLPGQEIPSIRDLAIKLRVNPTTVAKAYDELARAGIVDKRDRSGTNITQNVGSLLEERRRTAGNLLPSCEAEPVRALIEQIDKLRTVATRIKAPLSEVIRILGERWEK